MDFQEKRKLWCELVIHVMVYDIWIFKIYMRGELYKKNNNWNTCWSVKLIVTELFTATTKE